MLFLFAFECVRLKTLHPKSRKNEFKSFSGKGFGEDICQLILSTYKVELHNSFLNLLSYEMMADVNVL